MQEFMAFLHMFELELIVQINKYMFTAFLARKLNHFWAQKGILVLSRAPANKKPVFI